MKTVKSSIFWGSLILVTLLFMPGALLGQEEPSDCVVGGALAYDNWTKVDSGGAGSLPEGAQDSDYIRCKACHGWDHMATDGGYVRRSRNEGRPNAGAGDGDATSRNISFAARGEGEMVTADMIWHMGTGRSYEDGKGSWVALEDTHSASNKAAHSNGYTLGNQHPDFSTGGMTMIQADCLTEFLNYEDADPTAYFADINPDMNPVLYTIVDTADAAAGEAYYDENCDGCHGDPAGESPVDAPEGGILAYLAQDGKFSEFSHKVRWGIPDTGMTRGAMGSPTSADVANMMLWLQQEGGTGFALNPGLTGTWWNPARSGEGFLLEFAYNGDTLTFFGSFYTYQQSDVFPFWIVFQPVGGVVPESGTTLEAIAYATAGTMWGDGFNPDDVQTDEFGTATFTFTDCGTGHVLIEPNEFFVGHGFTSNVEYTLERTLDSAIECPSQ